MALPSDAVDQARDYHLEQMLLAAEASQTVGRLLQAGMPWARILGRWAGYQLQAATLAVGTMARWAGREEPNIDPVPFAGVTSFGYALAEPLIATIDARVPAPTAEPIPPVWWQPGETDRFIRQAQQLIAAEVQDAARSAAGAEMVTEQEFTKYVRVLRPPSCKRCVVLAGKVYRDLDGFERHPGCDCTHYPVESWEEAHDAGLVSSPEEAFEKGAIRDLTQAERRAIEDGADITTVINSSTGIYTADVMGRRAKATTYGTTKRALWRTKNPSALVRLRPEGIYKLVDQRHGGDRDVALRMLKENGYLTELGSQTLDPVQSTSRQAPVFVPSVSRGRERLPARLRTELDAVAANIEALTGPLPAFEVEGFAGEPVGGLRGEFDPNRMTLRINVNTATAIGPTIAHEIGHLIDFAVLGGGHGFASETVSSLTPSWLSGMAATTAVRDLDEMRVRLSNPASAGATATDRYWSVLQMPDGRLVGWNPDARQVTYLLRPTELWARGFAQWVAQNSTNAALLQGIRHDAIQSGRLRPGTTLYAGNRAGYPAQWDEAEFARRVAPGYDQLLRRPR